MDAISFYAKQSHWLERYGTGRHPPGFWRRFLARTAISRLEAVAEFVQPGRRLLDLGCSNGELLGLVGDRFSELYGVDLGGASLAKIKKDMARRWDGVKPCYLVSADLNQGIIFRSRMFDSVTAIAVLEHVFDVHAFVSECYRVLRPGGYFIVEVPNLAYVRHRLRLLLGKLPVTSCPDGWNDGFGWDGGHLHYFTIDDLKGLLQWAGFTPISYGCSGGTFGRFRNTRVSLLAGNIVVKAIKNP